MSCGANNPRPVLGPINPRVRLIQAANELRRTVFASLPWGIRVGSLLFNLRFAADARSFGRLAYRTVPFVRRQWTPSYSIRT